MTLGQRIQDHRTRLGLSQEGLGDKLGVSRQAVSKWEADGAVPDTDKLIALSRLFGITLNELLQVEEPPEPEGETSPDYLVKKTVLVRRPGRREVLMVLLAAALVAMVGVNLNLAARVNELDLQMERLWMEREKSPDPEDLVADWSFNVLDYDVDGSTVRFQVTTARYDPSQELEVFFLLTKGDEEPRRIDAPMDPEAPGVYTADVENRDHPVMSNFTLSVGFVRDGVEDVLPLADFDTLGGSYSRYEPLWPHD